MEHRAFGMSTINTSIHEVFETRKLMEIELVGLAAERSTQEDIKKMQEAIIDTNTIEDVSASDASFHRSLVEAARNSVFSAVYQLVIGLLFQTHRYYSFLKHDEEFETFLRNIFDQHGKILKAIESHDVSSAKEAIKEHLDYAEKKLLGSIEASSGDRN
jgi:DNA-binding FadR family transcriptional regulator